MSNLSSVIDDRAAVPARSLSDEELDAEIAELHRAEQRLAALKVDRVAEAGTRRFFEALGFGSPAAWLRARLGVRHGVARSWVGLARALPHMPRTRDAFAAGDIDESRVRVLCEARSVDPHAYAEAEETLVDAAVALSSDELGVYGEDGPDEIPFVNVWRFLSARTDALPEIYHVADDATGIALEDVGDTPLWDALGTGSRHRGHLRAGARPLGRPPEGVHR